MYLLLTLRTLLRAFSASFVSPRWKNPSRDGFDFTTEERRRGWAMYLLLTLRALLRAFSRVLRVSVVEEPSLNQLGRYENRGLVNSGKPNRG